HGRNRLHLEAQVTGAQTLPGTVQFFDGGVEIGSPVAVVDGVATIVHTFTSTGPHHVHAVYSVARVWPVRRHRSRCST
ncbi:hypothetical protein GS444_12060, partial [Rhodococcus hoagii]|nr:hypothetical protein [Prescottella equi]